MKILGDSGMSQRVIARTLSISNFSVLRTLARISEVRNYQYRGRSRWPKVTSMQIDRAIHRLVIQDPSISSMEIHCNLPRNGPLPCSSTIKRRLINKFNLVAHKPAKKSSLTLKNIKDGISFCKRLDGCRLGLCYV